MVTNALVLGNVVRGGNAGNGGDGFYALSGGAGQFLPLQGNGGNAAGGGVYAAGTVTLTNVGVAWNVVQGGNGGAGGNGNPGTTLAVSGTAGHGGNGGNGGTSKGGGIYVASGTLTLTNCTVTANSAIGTRGGAGGTGFINGTPGANESSIGGGLYNAAATVVLQNTRVSGNSADTDPDIGP
jgi:hypothetical protein